MDHHCGWVNNCIGSKNYLLFIVYLISMAFNVIFVFLHINEGVYHTIPSIGRLSLKTFPLFLFYFIIYHPFLFIYALIMTFFIVFLAMLIYGHLKQIRMNTTTNEGMNMKRYKHFYIETGSILNPFSRFALSPSCIISNSIV